MQSSDSICGISWQQQPVAEALGRKEITKFLTVYLEMCLRLFSMLKLTLSSS